ncbi:hypothetical protein Ciccas_004740 [Cichlidogyrus casuarinus]|uniref:Uncharacterized protein n=1 Tax=Cichlidogyrus casuarinus TaxID=1844966 RepID=A0ABD2QAS7_9PLAT
MIVRIAHGKGYTILIPLLAPNDDLDLKIKSQYNQHTDFLKTTAEALLQKETVGNTKRVLKRRIKAPPEEIPPMNHPIKMYTYDRALSLFCSNNAISGNHTLATNGGYSRKPDGGYFTG